MKQEKTYSVLIIDNFHHDPDQDYVINGFPTLKLAIEFARRFTRDSLEEQRKRNQMREELRKLWYQFGEDALVLGHDYKGSDEIEFFINNPATKEEIDWQAIKKEAGLD